mmetsp:Transcript_137723/g.239473  ORF Transcript_137723/g.239473 Transcript_137723/m.239473 type:complete len:864 (-) Transcript_137723:485-3076(-)
MPIPVKIQYLDLCREKNLKPNQSLLKLIADPLLVECDLTPLYLGLKGISVFVQILKSLLTVQVLRLKNSQLTNEIAVEIAEVCKGHPNIQHLDLSDNPLTLPAAKALLELVQDNPNVRRVDLQGTEVSDHYQNRILLQADLNSNQTQPRKDNALLDEETRRVLDDDWEVWECDSNYGDQLLQHDQEIRDMEAEEELLSKPEWPLPAEEHQPQRRPHTPPADASTGPGLHRHGALRSVPGGEVVSQLCKTGATGEKWTDPDFPPSVQSVWSKAGPARRAHKRGSLHWRRVGELCPTDKPFGEGGIPAPPQHGALADGWFISACAVLYRYPEFLKRLFRSSHPLLGVHELQFHKGGQWIRVTIDDWVPTDEEGRPLFAACADPEQPWPLLLEKAYAKLHGGYDRLELGTSAQALEDLTGGQCRHLTLKSLPSAKEFVRTGVLEDEMQAALRAESVLAACYRAKDPMLQSLAAIGNGVYPNHLYSVLRIQRLEEWTLVQLHDPWGKADWVGKFGPGTADWTEDRRQALQYYLEDEAAGYLWMTFEDFATFFNRVYILGLYPPDCPPLAHKTLGWSPSPWQTIRHVSRWEGRTAGGRFREENWTENPMYLVKVAKRNTSVIVRLEQPDARLSLASPTVDYPQAIGFYVVKTDAGKRKKKYYSSARDTVYSARFGATRAVSAQVLLQKDEDYLVIPCTSAPGQEGPFCLTVRADGPVSCDELADYDVQYRSPGVWRQMSAGGRITGQDSWVNNPQYHLQMKQTGRACITLHQKPNDTGPLHHIAFYVFKGSKPVEEYDAKSVEGFSDFLPYKTVFREFELQAGDYVVVPMTWNKGQAAAFSLTCYTPAAARLVKFARLTDQETVPAAE